MRMELTDRVTEAELNDLIKNHSVHTFVVTAKDFEEVYTHFDCTRIALDDGNNFWTKFRRTYLTPKGRLIRFELTD